MAAPAPPVGEPRGAQAYPKEARLRLRRDFLAVRSRGRRFTARLCVVRTLAASGAAARLGIAAPRAYGKAVRRNRFKRLVRAAFRRVRARLRPVDLLVEPRRDLGDEREPTLADLEADLLAAAGRGPR